MDQRTDSRVRDWDARPFSGGYDALRDLADGGFSGAVVTVGDTWLFMLNGRIIGVFQGRIEDFEAFREHYTEVRYADWISRGKIPEAGSYIRVPVEALVDVVDIAIDSQKRVIHDPTRDVYAVVDDNHLYEFRKDAGPGWMNEFGFPPINETNSKGQGFSPPEDHDTATRTEKTETRG